MSIPIPFFVRSAVHNPVIFHYIPVRATPFVRFVAEGDPDLPAALDLVESDDVVGVSMPDRDAILTVVENPVVLCDPVFHAPAEEKPQPISCEVIILHNRALRSGTRMQSQIGVAQAPAIRHGHIVANLP